jgi:hypothetical protein
MAQTHSPTIDPSKRSEKVQDHLYQALGADTPTEKNYHIRCALQYYAIETSHE